MSASSSASNGGTTPANTPAPATNPQDTLAALNPLQLKLPLYVLSEDTDKDFMRYVGPTSGPNLPKKIFLSPLTPEGEIAFLHEAEFDVDRDAPFTFRLPPTRIFYLKEKRIRIGVCVLESPENAHSVVESAYTLGQETVSEKVPVLGADVEVLPYIGSTVTLEEVEAACLNVPSDDAPEAEEAVEAVEMVEEAETVETAPSAPFLKAGERFNDAVVVTDLNFDDYKKQQITFMSAKIAEAPEWFPETVTLPELTIRLSHHNVGPKEGRSYWYADAVEGGPRKKHCVNSMQALVFDIDGKLSLAEAKRLIAKFGVYAIIYTSHSHLKTRTNIPRELLLKFAKSVGLGADVENAELIRRYLIEKKDWDPTAAETAVFVEAFRDDDGKRMIHVKHSPIEKFRIVIPLLVPFDIEEQGTEEEAAHKWKSFVYEVAEKIGLPFDKSGTDTTRLFYLPRHTKDHVFEILLFGGPLLDYRDHLHDDGDIEALAAEFASKERKTKTAEGLHVLKLLGKRAANFQVQDWIDVHAPHIKRGLASSGGYTTACPYDECHSNAGDSSDTGSFAVNAGYNNSPIFTWYCCHGSCGQHTAFDRVGKCMKNEGIPDDTLLDDNFFSEFVEETPPKKSPPPKSDPAPETDEKETATGDADQKKSGKSKTEPGAGDKPKLPYELAIAELKKGAWTDEHLENVLKLVLKAKLNPSRLRAVKEQIKEKTGVGIRDLDKHYKQIKDALNPTPGESLKLEDGVVKYRYQGKRDFHTIKSVCLSAIKSENKRLGYPEVCCFGEQLVMLRFNEEGRYEVAKMDQDALWAHVTELVHVFHVGEDDEDGSNSEKVPEDVAKSIYKKGHKKLPQAPAIFYSPTLLADGTLLQTTDLHYDAKNPKRMNHLLKIPDGINMPTIGNTLEAALKSVTWIRENLFINFPFLDFDANGNEIERDKSPSEKHAFSLLLTPAMRAMFPPGRTPVHHIDKPMPGAGGSLLGALPMLIWNGEVVGSARYSDNVEELNKDMLATAKRLEPFLFYDDVVKFKGNDLHRAIFSAVIGGRNLGTSDTLRIPNNFVWIINGVNVDIDAAMERRRILININPRLTPEQNNKREFKHDLEAFVNENRGEIIAHILTMISYWIAKGSPLFTKRKLLSVNVWAQKVGGVLEACGIDDGFLDSLPLGRSNMQREADLEMLDVWLESFGASEQKPTDIYDRLSGLIPGHDSEKRPSFDRFIRRVNGNAYELQEGEFNHFVKSLPGNKFALTPVKKPEPAPQPQTTAAA